MCYQERKKGVTAEYVTHSPRETPCVGSIWSVAGITTLSEEADTPNFKIFPLLHKSLCLRIYGATTSNAKEALVTVTLVDDHELPTLLGVLSLSQSATDACWDQPAS